MSKSYVLCCRLKCRPSVAMAAACSARWLTSLQQPKWSIPTTTVTPTTPNGWAMQNKSPHVDHCCRFLSTDHQHHHNHHVDPPEWTNFNETKDEHLEAHRGLEERKRNLLLELDDKDAYDDVVVETTAQSSSFEAPRTSVLMELTDRVGVLHDVLRYFWKYDINISRIESRPAQQPSGQQQQQQQQPKRFDFFVDFYGSQSDPNVQKLLTSLKPMTDRLLILDEKEVNWFPRHVSELDLIAQRTLDAGTDLEADHPGFHDPVYRSRRALLTTVAKQHRWDKPIDRIDYTPEEINTWAAVWDRMQDLWDKYACKEYLTSLQLMKIHCGYDRDRIPQQEDISDFLQRRTNYRLRPVAGLLSSRDFLNGLAFRVFFSTQYIRHHSKPLYTPEPDICHELLGHAPMLADPDFADFSQEIGLASLGASDDDVRRLAHCYWHSVEFGLCREDDNTIKAYGAGLLSSFGELEYACSDDHPGADTPPEIKPWEPAVAACQAFPITTYQPVYFLAESLQDAKQRMREYCEDLPRPFFAMHNSQTDTVHIDRPVRRTTRGLPNGNN